MRVVTGAHRGRAVGHGRAPAVILRATGEETQDSQTDGKCSGIQSHTHDDELVDREEVSVADAV
jgi:hypothetical protein